ncbi:hypothetical protein KJE20_11171 [Pyrenophora tritici-repentis]|nr:hypothetical protein KJE20_11171 [Pyrenophora tritici-repentis]
MSSNDIPSGDVVDNDYTSRTGQSQIPVQKDEAPVESTEYDNGGDSDKQLERDEKDAIDSSNIIEERTRGATKTSGTYREPGDEEGLARIARHKAIHQKVYIGGVKGCHTLETGVAYHYRGHFVYAYPAGVPVEPVPYSTKQGINIVGVAQHLAPPYDRNAPDLVDECTISALKRACVHEFEYQQQQQQQQQQEELRKKETEGVLEEEAKPKEEVETEAETVAVTTDANEDDVTTTHKETAPQRVSSAPLSRVSSKTTLFVPTPVASRSISLAALNARISPDALNSTSISLAALNNAPRMGTVAAPLPTHAPSTLAGLRFTPHDRGHYLAYSAPGSRQASIDNTPLVSRAVSPNYGLSVPGHGLHRSAASTTRLEQLLSEEGVRRSMTSLRLPGFSVKDSIEKFSVKQGWMDPEDVIAFVEIVSQHPSRQASRQQSRDNSPGPTTDEEKDGLYLHRTGHSDMIGTTTSKKQTPNEIPIGTRSPFDSSSDSEDANEFEPLLGGLESNHVRSMEVLSKQKKPVSQKSETPHVGSQIKPSPLSQLMINRAPRSPNRTDMPTTPPFAFPIVPETGTSAFPSFQDTPPRSPSYVPTHTGRPRAASKILNEAYNAANPSNLPRTPTVSSMAGAEKPDVKHPVTTSTLRCSIHHSEACDGKFVSQQHLTQRHREGNGFKDLVPTINCVDGRTMVDWAMIRDQEMEKMRIEKGEK